MKKLPALAALLLACSAPAPAADPPARATVQALVERQMASWASGDEAAFLATLHPEAVFAYPGKRLTRDGALASFRAFKAKHRATQLRLHRLVIDGSGFAAEYLFATTNAATGQRSAGGTVAIGEVRDGRILVWKEYLDGRVARGQAAGELPVDERAEPFPWPDTPQSRVP